MICENTKCYVCYVMPCEASATKNKVLAQMLDNAPLILYLCIVGREPDFAAVHTRKIFCVHRQSFLRTAQKKLRN